MKSRTSLLLIPGLAANRTMWEPQIEALSDLVDCWVAPLPAWDDLGEIAEHILRAAPQTFALAGWSMGGYLCFEILRRAPHRVSRLALMSTTADPETATVTDRRRASVHEGEVRGFPPMIRDLVPRFLNPARVQDTDLVSRIVDQALEVGPEAYRMHQQAMVVRPEYRTLLPEIDCPTTVIVGRQDALTRVSAHARMARSIPQAHLEVIENSGHIVTLEQPEATSTVMRHWLTDRDRAIAA